MTSDPLWASAEETDGLSFSEIREKIVSGEIRSLGPFKIYSNKNCNYCHQLFTRETWKDCPECHSGPYYCSDACVINDKVNHKKDCYWRRQYSIAQFRSEFKSNHQMIQGFNRDIKQLIPRKERKNTSVIIVRFNYDTVNIVSIHLITPSIQEAEAMMLTEGINARLYLPSNDCVLETIFCSQCNIEHHLQKKCVAYFKMNLCVGIEDPENKNFVLVDLEDNLDHFVPITQEQADDGNFIRIY
jgi:hypothetical protein